MAASVGASSSPAAAVAPYTLEGLFPGPFANGPVGQVPAMQLDDAFGAWRGKSPAIVNFFGKAPEATVYLQQIWDRHQVPMLSTAAPVPNSVTALGGNDEQLIALRAVLRKFLAGNDSVLGTGDDRRAYIRYGWESNVASMDWSPCSAFGGTGQDFSNAWQHAHDLIMAAPPVTGERPLDAAHLQWVYNVGAGAAPCPEGDPSKTYPGSAYVDWLGIDFYAGCWNEPPSTAINGMDTTLRNIANAHGGARPLSVNEVGVSSNGATAAEKNQWITDYWTFVSTDDIRMSLWFNANTGTNSCSSSGPKPWTVFTTDTSSDAVGDSSITYNGTTYYGFSGYRTAAAQSWVLSADTLNPRLLTDDQFRGL